MFFFSFTLCFLGLNWKEQEKGMSFFPPLFSLGNLSQAESLTLSRLDTILYVIGMINYLG